eukprot:gene7952-biopygen8031
MTGVQIVGPAPCHGGPDAPDGEGTSHTGLDLLGVMDELGFVLVAPTGRRDCWNHTYFASAYPYSTACCACPQQGTECRRRCGFDMDGVRNGEDTDAQDVAGIIQHLKVQMAVDASRTYAIGFSVGAVLAHRLACEHSSIFAAVIAISGGLQTAHCAPSEPVSILQMHGTADPVVDYDITVAKTLAAWSANNGCSKPEGDPWVDNIGTANAAELINIAALSERRRVTVEGTLHRKPSIPSPKVIVGCGHPKGCETLQRALLLTAAL